MTEEELLDAMEEWEEIEYHVMGNETDPERLLPAPGWYSCTVEDIHINGNVEIVFTDLDLGVTVLKKNIGIAFRRKAGVQA